MNMRSKSPGLTTAKMRVSIETRFIQEIEAESSLTGFGMFACQGLSATTFPSGLAYSRWLTGPLLKK